MINNEGVTNPKITVLMSTYNGEKYLLQQLESIKKQKNVQVRLIVRDDGSNDKTIGILETFQKELNEENSIMSMDYKRGNNKGAKESFLDLIFETHDTEFIALADQDDVWDEDKLESAIRVMMKNTDLQNEPVLYMSNLRIVDSDLNFIRYNKVAAPNINCFNSFFELWCTGCTMVYNKRMERLICHHRPKNVIMHDAWIGFIGYQLGKTVYDVIPHISYRQHENNVVGVKLSNNIFEFVMNGIKNLVNVFSKTDRVSMQETAEEYICFYKDILDKEQLHRAEEVAYYKSSPRRRLRFFLDRRFSIMPLYHDIYYHLLILAGRF